MRFEWDPNKNELNKAKHNISFELQGCKRRNNTNNIGKESNK